MKKIYEQPAIEEILFQFEDIASNSGMPGEEPSNGAGVDPDGW